MKSSVVAGCVGLALVGASSVFQAAQAAATIYHDEATFRAAAGPVRTYGFEVTSLTPGVDEASPVLASQFDNSFDIAYTGLNAFQIDDNPGSPFVVDGNNDLFTHSSAAGPNYTLTFSNFGATNRSITAFGLTIVDFASNMPQQPASIDFNAGALSGTLLSVPGAQPDYTQNFIGLTVDPAEAFGSITLTLDDIRSGFQSFDRVLFSTPAGVPEPGTLLTMALGLALLGWQRRKA